MHIVLNKINILQTDAISLKLKEKQGNIQSADNSDSAVILWQSVESTKKIQGTSYLDPLGLSQ